VARVRRIALFGLILGVVGSTPAVSSVQRTADVGLTLVDQGTVLTGADVGLPPGQSVSFPNAVLLPDGRIRLYYLTPYFGDPPGGPSGIFSAISTDGLHFTPELGRRSPMGGSAFDVERLPDGRWRSFSVLNAGGVNGIVSAISADGLTFTGEPGVRLPNPVPEDKVLTCCGIVRLADGGYRMYVTDRLRGGPGAPPPQVYTAVSPDLFDWTLEPGVRQSVDGGQGQPAALANPDGSMLLAFGGEFQWSADGLNFNPPAGTGLTGYVSGPSFVTRPDGTVLMYYSRDRNLDTDGQTIGVALVTRVAAPTVSYPTPAATDVTATSATLHAIVNPQGAKTSYHFDYGTTTAYGDTSLYDTIAAQNEDQNVSGPLTNLLPATTYHFRVRAENTVGEVVGEDQTFTTAAGCVGHEQDRGWEVAFVHATTASSAMRLLPRARQLRRGPLLEQDGCADYELAIPGLASKRAATNIVTKAKTVGFPRAAVERT
jgi:hypothetical protein